ncbi:carbohydrate-binding module family 18 protein [Diplogelasinospora grovesii]|uniref:Carbohydrate-binding module family 18 protein n=1 Tax=Diplogelasinospora grovesii TaxID=303347 RepID=A0AAN6S2A6_9PEZI|nr:carbohydrate-binding module family 18 protein [Diplogelasinospora grovesii]
MFLRSQNQSLPIMFLFAFFLLSILFLTVRASNDCQPVTWSNTKRGEESVAKRLDGVGPRDNATTTTPKYQSLVSTGNVSAGEINCRYSSTTGSDVNYYTCTQLATRYGITNDVLFTLNPTLSLDCSNIQPNTPYCVAGFIEPLRSTDGRCGPQHNNATCLGTAYQCCNSETWTCGNSTDDCAAGTCYEGACAGDIVYSTDGTCGSDHGNRLCAGKWGNCCNTNGTCGTGEAFCGTDVCQSGNCTRPVTVPSVPDWLGGNTTDGTCGGANKFSCNVVYGNCCNKDGMCGSLMSDCGVGCQPQWGNCSSISTPSSSSTTSSSSVPTGATTTPSTTTKTTCSSTISFSSLPTCGQTCINNMLAQYSALGCASPDPSCLCSNVNFGYGIRDCSNGACGTAVASTVIAYGSAYCSCALATVSPTSGTATTSAGTPTTTVTDIASLPSCGQLCFNNMLVQYSALGCASEDPACLCSNVNFGYGLRDCSNGACGTAVASTVIAFGSAYCASASATATAAG